MQYELSHEESDLLKAGLYFSVQPDKTRKSEIFTTFEKIHRVLLTTLNARKPNLRLKHISRILLILISTTTNLPTYTTSTSRITKDKDIIITKPDKENGVVILDRKLYDNAIQEIISDTFKFEKLNEDPALKREASLNVFYVS